MPWSTRKAMLNNLLIFNIYEQPLDLVIAGSVWTSLSWRILIFLFLEIVSAYTGFWHCKIVRCIVYLESVQDSCFVLLSQRRPCIWFSRDLEFSGPYVYNIWNHYINEKIWLATITTNDGVWSVSYKSTYLPMRCSRLYVTYSKQIESIARASF